MNKIIQSTKNRVHNFYAIKSPIKRTYKMQMQSFPYDNAYICQINWICIKFICLIDFLDV